jgi:branched-chain amino acid transport system substrate-binding protein
MRFKSILATLIISILFFLTACSEKVYEIEFMTFGGLEIENQIVKSGESFVLPLTTKQGYTFDGWFIDENFSQVFNDKKEIDSNLRLYAKWLANAYIISFETNSEIQMDPITVFYDQQLDIDHPIRDEYYEFQGWYIDNEFTVLFHAAERPASDITLYARWTLDYTYTYENFSNYEIIEINFSGFQQNVQFILSKNAIYAKASNTSEGYEVELYIVGINEDETYVYHKELSDDCWSLEIENNSFSDSSYYVSLLDMFNLIPSSEDIVQFSYSGNQYDLMSNFITQYEQKLAHVLLDVDLYSLPEVNLVSHELIVDPTQIELKYHVIEDDEPLKLVFSNVNQIEMPNLDLELCANDYVQGVSSDHILVGTSVTTSGAMAILGVPFLAGMQAYFNHINDLGGIAGRTIELINYDHQFDTTLGYNQVETLINTDRVFGLIGIMGTSVVVATTQLVKDIGIPSVYPVSQSNVSLAEINEGWSIFPVQPTNHYEGVSIGYHAITHPIYGTSGNEALSNTKKVGVLYGTDANSLEMYLGIMGVLLLYGYTVEVGTIDINQNTIPYQVARLANLDISALIVVSPNHLFLNVIGQVIEQSFDVPIFTTSLNAIPLHLDSRSSLQVYANAWVDYANSNEYVTIMMMQDYANYLSNPQAIAGYIAAYVFVEGLRRVGEQELTWKSYIKAMESAPIITPMGAYLDYSSGIRLGSSLFLVKYNKSINAFDIYE